MKVGFIINLIEFFGSIAIIVIFFNNFNVLQKNFILILIAIFILTRSFFNLISLIIKLLQ